VLIERFSLGLVLQLWLRCYERILSVNRLFWRKWIRFGQFSCRSDAPINHVCTYS